MYADCRATLASPAAGIADGDAAHRRCVLSGITSLKPRVCQLGRFNVSYKTLCAVDGCATITCPHNFCASQQTHMSQC